jgi:hypothetical protein
VRIRKAAATVVALLAIAPSGCGLTSSPASGLTFRPPPGWRPSPSVLGFVQFWRSPADDRELLMLFRSPRELQPSDIFSDSRLQSTLQHVTVERRTTINICGNQPARYVEASGTSQSGQEDRVDMVMTNTSGKSYFAMYIRPVVSPTDPMAEAALRELCAKP